VPGTDPVPEAPKVEGDENQNETLDNSAGHVVEVRKVGRQYQVFLNDAAQGEPSNKADAEAAAKKLKPAE
jgi:hypothetical protein